MRAVLLGMVSLLSFANAEYAKYKDPKQPVAVRVKDLLGRMSLEEKIGQMVQIDRTIATVQFLKDYSIGNYFNYSFCIFFISLSIWVNIFISFKTYLCLSTKYLWKWVFFCLKHFSNVVDFMPL